MRVLIIEDENRIAKRLLRMVKDYFGDQLTEVIHRDEVNEGINYLNQHPVDLLLLDLNLNGEDGFQVLQQVTAADFHVIIVSAYQDRAIQAFEYGVLDFVPKPFSSNRLFSAFDRLSQRGPSGETTLKYLSIQKRGAWQLFPIQEVLYAKGAGIYTELFFRSGQKELHSKNLDKLSQLLPKGFFRIHKSYLVDITNIQSIRVEAGGKYTAVLKDGQELPIGRTKYTALKSKLMY